MQPAVVVLRNLQPICPRKQPRLSVARSTIRVSQGGWLSGFETLTPGHVLKTPENDRFDLIYNVQQLCPPANPSCQVQGCRILLLSPLTHLTFSQIPASDIIPKYLMKGSILPLRRARETAPPIALVSSRTDGGGGGAEVHDLNFRDAPLQLFFRDIKLVLTLLRWLPKLFSPLRTESPYGELYMSSRNIWEILLHVFLGLCGGLMVLVSVPLLIAAPVSLFVLYVVVCRGLMFLLSWPLNNGPRTVTSNADLGDVVVKPEERWAFVNGVCAGQYWLQGKANLICCISFVFPACWEILF